jgi:hypothetical protein
VPSVLVVGGDHDNVAVPLGAVTVTVVLCAVVPPAPVQLNVNVAAAFITPVVRVPLMAIAPFQPPEAVQEVALVAAHCNMAVPPWGTLAGVAVSERTGADDETVTVAD